jgi:hypothetical protein
MTPPPKPWIVTTPDKVRAGAIVRPYMPIPQVTAIKVSPTGAKVTVREDTATRTDGNGMSDQQQYEYTPNPDGELHIFHRDAEGKYRGRGKVLVLGTRRTYHDFSF